MKKILSVTVLLFLFPTLMFGQSFQWAKQIGGVANDFGSFSKIDLHGNIIICGSYNDLVDFDPGIGNFDIGYTGCPQTQFVLKLDSSGNFLWAHDFGLIPATITLNDMTVDLSGNILFTGYFVAASADFDWGTGTTNLSSGTSSSNGFILKIDPNGNFIWAKQDQGSGGSDTSPQGIITDTNGDVLIVGAFRHGVDFDPGAGSYIMINGGNNNYSDIFILRLDSNGNFLWAKGFGGTDGEGANHVQFDNSGNIIIQGSFGNITDLNPDSTGVFNLLSPGMSSVFVAKYDANGNFIWGNKITNSVVYNSVLSLNTDASGNIYFTGYFEGTLDLDPGSATLNQTSIGGYDFYIIKLDSNGAFSWGHSFGEINDDWIYGSDLDFSGNIYMTGFFQNTIDFDPGVGTFNLTSDGLDDMYIEKLDENGIFQWAKKMGGTDNDRGYGIGLNNSGEVFITGKFSGTADINPDAGVNNLTSNGIGDIFIMKLGAPIICTASASTINATSCDTYTSPSGNNSWNTSGTYMDTIPNVAGCDSVITINLTINNNSSTQTISACNSFTSPSGNYTWNTSGTYLDTITNAAGCDSVLTFNLTINSVTAAYTLYPDPDTTQLHHWFAIANVTGTTPFSYLWSWGDGNTDVGATPSHTYSAAAFYAICLSVTDGAGCTTTYCDSSSFISKTEEERLIITINVVTQLPNGIATVTSAANNMSVTPNPCTNCEITGVENAMDLTVTDILGRKQNVVFSKSANGFAILLPESVTGIFIVRNIKSGGVVKFVRE